MVEHAYRGRLFFEPTRLVYAGPIGTTDAHAHHTFQLLLAPEAVVLADAHGREARCTVAIVPADVAHEVRVGSARGVLLHVSADGPVGRRLTALGSEADVRSWQRAGEPLARCLTLPLPRTFAEVDALAATMLQTLALDERRPPPAHPAIFKLVRRLPALLDGDVRIAALAADVGLSPSRLSHLFGAQVGLPLRRYVLWLRLMRAASHLQHGASLTEAAHAAGFSDAAHLSHTFRRTFGLAPSAVTGAVEWMVRTDQTA